MPRRPLGLSQVGGEVAEMVVLPARYLRLQ